jgi:phage-related protein
MATKKPVEENPVEEKPIVWVGSSLKDLKALPQKPRRDIGFALSGVQQGEFPVNAKPLKGLGAVYEIRVDYDSDTYRGVYAVNIGKSIYVLHVFKKKSKKGIETPKQDVDLIRTRLKLAQEDADENEE